MKNDNSREQKVDLERLKQEIEADLEGMRRSRGDSRPRLRPVPDHQISSTPEIQAQALSQLESMLGEREGRRLPSAMPDAVRPERDLRELSRRLAEEGDLWDLYRRLETVVSYLTTEVRRVSDDLARIRPAGRPKAVDAPAGAVAEDVALDEGATRVVIEGVADLHRLMAICRALDQLPASEGAALVEYAQGVATLDLRLRTATPANDIVAWLLQSTDERLAVEEAQPGSIRLRSLPTSH